MTFTFTEAWNNLNSSLVKGIFHDADKRQMLVRLSGDKQYVYTNVDKAEAARLANAGSKGRAYNDFRQHRQSYQKGSVAHGEIVAPKEQARRVEVGSVPSNSSFTFAVPGGVTSTFEVDFSVNGSTFTSTTQAASLAAAAQDVENKVKALGLVNAKLTAVRLKA